VVIKARELLGNLNGKVVALLGLAFKPNTDDMRDAPALSIARALQLEGAHVRGYDPVSMNHARRLMPSLEYCEDAYVAAQDAHALIVCTEWNEFKQLDLERIKSLMKTPNIVDGRNLYDPAWIKRLGFNYCGIGRR
jgi:UDPglucose 6-dehydrogenase